MEIRIKIVGLSPGMLMHKFSDEHAAKATSGRGKTSSPQEERSSREIAEHVLYTTPEGKPFLPETWLIGSWRSAGRDYKIGKRQVSTARSSIVPAAITIVGAPILIEPGTWEVDSRPVTIPATGGRILRHRPRFEAWEATFNVELDDTMISSSMFRNIVDDSGKKIGIGDFRPERSGPFGRYRVDSWEVLDPSDKEAKGKVVVPKINARSPKESARA